MAKDSTFHKNSNMAVNYYENELIRDFIPVLDNQGKAGMYDKVGKKIYMKEIFVRGRSVDMAYTSMRMGMYMKGSSMMIRSMDLAFLHSLTVIGTKENF